MTSPSGSPPSPDKKSAPAIQSWGARSGVGSSPAAGCWHRCIWGWPYVCCWFSASSCRRRWSWHATQAPKTSIIAIAAVHRLEDHMHVAEIDNRELGWSVGILLAFVVSGLLLALMDRLGGSEH
jgi:hypothetical protein